MKKTLITIAALILVSSTAHAAITVPWFATSTNSGYIAPNRINGNLPNVQATYFVATSTTATNLFMGNIGQGTTENLGNFDGRAYNMLADSTADATGFGVGETGGDRGLNFYWTGTAIDPEGLGWGALDTFNLASDWHLNGRNVIIQEFGDQYKVGIGTTSPYEKLSVEGNSVFNGNVDAVSITTDGLEIHNYGTLDFFSDAGVTQTGAIFPTVGFMGRYSFLNGLVGTGVLDFSGVSGPDKTYRFPNWSGDVVVSTSTTQVSSINATSSTATSIFAGGVNFEKGVNITNGTQGLTVGTNSFTDDVNFPNAFAIITFDKAINVYPGLGSGVSNNFTIRDPGLVSQFTVEGLTGNVGIGTSPSARLHVLSTTEQQRTGYDASNYYSATVGSTGGVTFDAVGSGSKFVYSDRLTVPDGTAALPSIGLSSDDDGSGTGLYRSAANRLGVSANGTFIGQFLSTGFEADSAMSFSFNNRGGFSAPANGQIRIAANGGANLSRFIFGSNTATGYGLCFGSNSTLSLCDGAGAATTTKFGIGTTTPGAELSVEGSSLLGNVATAGYFVATSTTATSTFATGIRLPGRVIPTSPVEIYASADVNFGSADALYITPPASSGRIYFGRTGKAAFSVNFANVTNVESFPATLAMQSTANSSYCPSPNICSRVTSSGDLALITSLGGSISTAQATWGLVNPTLKFKTFNYDQANYVSSSPYGFLFDTASSSAQMTKLTHTTWMTAGSPIMTLLPNGKFSVGSTTPIATFQVATTTANATTTVEFGKNNQNKGDCLKRHRLDGTAVYSYIDNTNTEVWTTTSCDTGTTGF